MERVRVVIENKYIIKLKAQNNFIAKQNAKCRFKEKNRELSVLVVDNRYLHFDQDSINAWLSYLLQQSRNCLFHEI